MPASASIESVGVGRSRAAATVGVYRYRPGASRPFELLPNVRVVEIQHREGPFPGHARFRYVFDDRNDESGPTSFQDALGVGVDLPGVVQNDERLVALTFLADGSQEILFDGFAQVPELNLAPDREVVTFLAFGVAIRAWDAPIAGALMRDADDPSTGEDVFTSLPTHFNPAGRPNASPEGADAVDPSERTYPTFLDPLVVREPDVRRHWTVAMASRYLCYGYNPDETFVRNPDGDLIDALLDSRIPRPGADFSPDDPDTYESEPLLVADYPATGKPWPVALAEILEPHGFGLSFQLATRPDGHPETQLQLFRRQDGSPGSYKELLLQPRGSQLDPSQSNLAEAHVARDVSGVANVIAVHGRPTRYEASFVLAPGFPIAAADAANSAALRAFDRNSDDFAREKSAFYRLYVLDETGEGHWDFNTSSLLHTPTRLGDLFRDDEPSNDPDYVFRRRPPIGELFTLDANRIPLRAKLAISVDYQGSQPGLWDGTGTWQTVEGGFELLRDRLGIWIAVPNPNGWNIQASPVAGAPFPSGIVKGVEDQALAGGRRFALRLTCVVESDRGIEAVAGRRASSPTTFEVIRRIDARDRYARHIIAPRSEFNPGNRPKIARDDADDAFAEAAAIRLASEAGAVAGRATIPRFTMAYRVGDKVRAIRGRGLSLRTNAGAPEEEGDVFPTIVGRTWTFDDAQRTWLQLSDQRGRSR